MLNRYTVMVQQEFHGVMAPDEVSASRQIEDLVKTGGFSPHMMIMVGTSMVRMRPVDEDYI